MKDIEEIRNLMRLSHGKKINLYFTDGDIYNNVFVDCYHQDEGEDEPAMLEIGNILVTINEIKDIEIKNQAH